MSHRYSLRFESGERAGEVVPITGAAFTVGRKPGNSLQINDASVSGKHAEFIVQGGEGVLLRDLGSTNGTRVGKEKIAESRLAAGTSLSIGQVMMTFLDGELAGQADAAPKLDIDEAPRVVSAENLARSRKTSKTGLLVLVVLAAGSGGAYWYMGQSGGTQDRSRPVTAVSGNMLADSYSFEEPGGWDAAEGSPALFRPSSRARRSGDSGLTAGVIEEEYAEHMSDSQTVRGGQGLTVRAEVRTRDDAHVQVGIRLETYIDEEVGGDGPSATTYWSDPLEASGWTEVELTASVPGGYNRARAVLRATSTAADGGDVDVDDVSLVPGTGGATATVARAQFYHDAGVMALFDVDRLLLTGVRVVKAGHTVKSTLSAESNGARLSCEGGGTFTARFERGALANGLATLGSGGYQAWEGEFEVEGTDVLVGSASDLLRVSLGGATNMRATRNSSGAIELTAALPAGRSVFFQLDFNEERRRVHALTAEAEDAKRRGDLGATLERWQTLLDEVPYDAPAVARAQSERAEILRAGFDEVRSLEDEIERASFFRLVDLFRECRAAAVAIGERYAGSEIEAQTTSLVASIDEQLVGLEATLDQFEVARLQAILAGLRAQKAEVLATEVERYLATEYNTEGN